MYGALAVMVLALAAFSVVVTRRRPATGDQLKGFVYVGAVALVVLAAVVVGVGVLADTSARAEGLAIFGCFTYAIYLAIALLVIRLTDRR